jgi:hypothetical protein
MRVSFAFSTAFLLLFACECVRCNDNSALSTGVDCCASMTCSDNSICPCCADLSCSDNMGCPSSSYGGCDASLQKDVAPIQFVLFQASPGDSYSIGDVVAIMARFPDGVCNLPDPATAGPMCTPQIEVSLTIKKDGQTQRNKVVRASSSMQTVQDQYSVDFSWQPEFYDQNGYFVKPWIFLLQVEAGMATTRLDVNWIQIPKACQTSSISFNSSRINYPSNILNPKVTIDTLPPAITLVYSTERSGSYTAGHYIDIVVKFSKDVTFSELPNIYSQATARNAPPGILALDQTRRRADPCSCCKLC